MKTDESYCCTNDYECARKAYRKDAEWVDPPRDPANPYAGPQDDRPVGVRDFVPLLVALCIIVLLFAAIALS